VVLSLAAAGAVAAVLVGAAALEAVLSPVPRLPDLSALGL
jgi:hypothetical protein